MILTILFYISLVGIIALFSLKAWEKRHGKVYAAALRERSDIAIESAVVRCVREYRRHDKERIVALVWQGFRYVRERFLASKNAAERSWKKILAKAEGRREHTRTYNAPVSFFLKQISDYKNGNGHLKSEKEKEGETPFS